MQRRNGGAVVTSYLRPVGDGVETLHSGPSGRVYLQLEQLHNGAIFNLAGERVGIVESSLNATPAPSAPDKPCCEEKMDWGPPVEL